MDSSHQVTFPVSGAWAGLSGEHRNIFSRILDLQDRVAHRFERIELLYEALTHRSAVVEHLGAGGNRQELPWNERLEFLGDAVLGLAVTRRLMERGPHLAEGELSRVRAAVVNEESLAEVARGIQLGHHLILGRGAIHSGARGRDSVLADALEAVIGAVFVDSGFAAADALVGRLLDDVLGNDLTGLLQSDYKTMLQEFTQDRDRSTPVYEVVSEEGPAHDRRFVVRALLGGREVGRGDGPSKKRASQEAARRALESLTRRPGQEESK